MSVLIKGMRIPENCTRCDHIGLNVAIGCPVMSGTNGRATDCPLVDLGKHGRIVDADAMMDDICNSINQMTKIGIAIDGNYLWGKLNDALNNALTILEAEDSE